MWSFPPPEKLNKVLGAVNADLGMDADLGIECCTWTNTIEELNKHPAVEGKPGTMVIDRSTFLCCRLLWVVQDKSSIDMNQLVRCLFHSSILPSTSTYKKGVVMYFPAYLEELLQKLSSSDITVEAFLTSEKHQVVFGNEPELSTQQEESPSGSQPAQSRKRGRAGENDSNEPISTPTRNDSNEPISTPTRNYGDRAKKKLRFGGIPLTPQPPNSLDRQLPPSPGSSPSSSSSSSSSRTRLFFVSEG